MVRCPGLSLRAQVKGNSFGYFEHDPWVLSLETKGKLDQKIFVTVQSPYWYLMTDLKVVTVYSSSLESRHQSPHNMNFFSF